MTRNYVVSVLPLLVPKLTAIMSLLVPKIRTTFPYPLLYGTIELDHARMVQGFNDPEVDEAVRGIIGKKYLVWIHLVRLIPPIISLCDPHILLDDCRPRR